LKEINNFFTEIYKEQKKNQSNSEGEYMKQLNINFQKVPSLKIQKEISNNKAGCC